MPEERIVKAPVRKWLVACVAPNTEKVSRDRLLALGYEAFVASQEEVRLICNEIYARHGYIFKNQAYNDYFSQFAWYAPSVTKENFSDSVFNQYERENVHTIAHYEKDMGWR